MRLVMCLATLVVLGIAFSSMPAMSLIPQMGEEEIEMGQDIVEDMAETVKILDDADLQARVDEIGQSIAEIANRQTIHASYGNSTITPFSYSFKVIDSKDVNAFSIPGGFIYIHKGLIDFCESDHELASVIAHEVAHCAHHHMVHIMRDQARLDGKLALVMMAGYFSSGNFRDMSNVVASGGYIRTGKTSSFIQKAEWDADATAMVYMSEAGYNPVGMLTFLERLGEKPDVVNWGILQTHPRTEERVQAIKEILTDTGVEVDRRAVTTSYNAVVTLDEQEDHVSHSVEVGSRLICKLVHKSAAIRFADQINELLGDSLRYCELSVLGNRLIARGDPILVVSDLDAELSGKSSEELAADALNELRKVIFRQMIAEM